MKLIISSDKNPYRNLSAEEYLLKNSDEDFAFLYINQPCVVVGKHQVAPKEINSAYTFKNKILIARRLSGGGAVFHDDGNLNFCFIQTVKSGENISYQLITQSIYKFLEDKGLDISLSGRNDFMLAGRKISGSAMHVYKNRVMAHCTLLINSNLEHLSNSLKGHPERYTDKSISSKRSKVLNLAEVDKNLTTNLLIRQFTTYLKTQIPDLQINTLPENSYDPINQLYIEKYSTSDWIYGYSPKYSYSYKTGVEQENICFSFEVEKGTIKNVFIESKDEINTNIKLKLNALTGTQHNIESIVEWLEKGAEIENKSELLDDLL
jgi:lipoate---protein ligase